ncbi:DUF6502 family protein [Marinobacter xestospongiae]|uniref:DUF6502 family protein n=1 Tax=Marinobacter xestospongiae TaxID=994319 RepID=A0ABU3W2C8_9GAMM|nr:DUF6502 family protein [Marinobacter xestospongiae]MDV2080151.1 DUF6502 family protein [Marinobacter xestospongiae]
MSTSEDRPLHKALFRILRPLARLLLRNGIPYGEFAELVKRAYVQASLEDFNHGRRKTTDSKAAVMTGLTRKEVKRLRESLADEEATVEDRVHTNRASRVVSGWVHDTDFQDARGEPRVLSFDGELGFSELVRRYSGDMTPRAVLDELLRVGVVAQAEGLVLRKRAYVPVGDDAELLNIFGEDVSDLISTVDFNLVSTEAGHQPLFQRTLTYNNIPTEVLDAWREYAADQSQALLESLDRWLGPYDRDISGKHETSQAVRTGVSIFYFEDPIQPPKEREHES